MGRRGPAPTPTRILRMRGSWRGDINDLEPAPPPGPPDKPAWLGPEASAEWDRAVTVLTAARILTLADAGVLAMYCDAWEKWLSAREFLSRHGDSHPVKDGNGRVKCFMPFPQASTYHKMALLLIRLGQELGLSPSGRSRLRAEAGMSPTPLTQEQIETRNFFLGGPIPTAGRAAMRARERERERGA